MHATLGETTMSNELESLKARVAALEAGSRRRDGCAGCGCSSESHRDGPCSSCGTQRAFGLEKQVPYCHGFRER